MHRLRILKFYGSRDEGMNRVHLSPGLKYNFSALKYLMWKGYFSINSPLSSFFLENLVILDMTYSSVEQLWEDALPLPKLKEVDLRYSCITSCPDLSGSPNLKKLNMFYCGGLREISPSVGRLNELESLNLCYCTSLEAIPDLSGLISLRDLYFTECKNLNCQNLEFGNLSKLRNLSLIGCKMLKRLPSTICKLISLQELHLRYCSELDQLPEDIGSLSSLKILAVEGTAIRELPSSITHLNKLEELLFSGLEVHWPNWRVRKLEELSFSGLGVDWPNRSDSDSTADGEELSKDDKQFLHYRFSSISDENWKLSISIDATDCRAYVDSIIWEITKCLSKLQLAGTAQEVLSSLCFQNGGGLSDFEGTLKKALHTLQKVKKACIMLQYPESEAPKGFDYQSTESFINLSPNWLNQNFMGFALCVVVAPCRENSGIPFRGTDVINWTCKLKSKNGQSFLMEGNFKEGLMLIFDHVLVELFPLLPFCPHILFDAEEISFEIIDNQYYKVEKCGVHLMYDQDTEEFDGSSHVGEDEDILSSTTVRHNCDEVDEPHPKRLKKAPY